MFLKRKLALLLVPLLLLFAVPSVSLADTGSQAQQLSMTDAVRMAQQANVSLQLSNVAQQVAQNNLAAFYKSYSNANPGNVFGTGIPQSITDLYSQVNNNYQAQYASKNYQQEISNVTYQTEVAYFKVQDAVYSEQLAEKAVQEAQEAYFIAQVSELQGTETATAVASSKAALLAAQGNLTSAKQSVDAAYVGFDDMVGLDPTARPDLTSTAAYDPNYTAPVSDIDQAVSQALANNPSVFLGQQNVNYQNELAPYNTVASNGLLNYQQAQLNQQQTVQTVISQARSAYLLLSAAQDQYNTAQLALSTAQATYEDALAEYNVGLITHLQLLQAEYGSGGSAGAGSSSGLSALSGQSGASSQSASGQSGQSGQSSSQSNSVQAPQISQGGGTGYMAAELTAQSALHALLEARAYLALVTGVGSVTTPVSGS